MITGIQNTMHQLFGTFFGLGFSKFAPGTVASIVACLLFYAIETPIWVAIPAIILLFFLGIRSADVLETKYEKDASCIVIDEVVGMWIAVLLIPHDWRYFLAALVLFRIFDISKIFFIKKAENLKGGLGVMADDVVAGIYSNLLLHLFIWFN